MSKPKPPSLAEIAARAQPTSQRGSTAAPYSLNSQTLPQGNVVALQPENAQASSPEDVQAFQPDGVRALQRDVAQAFQPDDAQAFSHGDAQTLPPDSAQALQRDNAQAPQCDNAATPKRGNAPASPQESAAAVPRGDAAEQRRDNVPTQQREAVDLLLKDIKPLRNNGVKKRLRDERPHTSIYLHPDTFDLIKIIAIKERVKSHDILVEGVRMAIEARGYNFDKINGGGE